MQLHRTALAALQAHAPGLARGRLHLTIGATLASLGGERAEEATEELRQALDLLGEEEAPLEHAEARHRLGALLLPLLPDSTAGGQVGEAARHLERAHRIFEEFDQPGSRVATAVLLAVALVDLGEPGAGRALLEGERERAEGELRTWVEGWLIRWYLEDAEPARRAEGEAMLARYLAGGCPAMQGTDDQIVEVLSVLGTRLPPGIQEIALAWLERQPDPPLMTVAALRGAVRRGDARWLKPEERARLEAQLEDAGAPLPERCNAAYTLLGSLPPDEHRLRRRAIELLEGWLDAPEIDPLNRAWYRHDLAAAMHQVGADDPAMLRRAARHLEEVIPSLPTRDRPAAQHNLGLTLLQALRLEAEVSSPALLDLAGRIDDLARSQAPEVAAELRLEAASHLVHWSALTHPECLEAAQEFIDQVIAANPRNPDAWRMRAFCTWIRHCQGRAGAADVAEALARARELGPVPELKRPRGMSAEQHRAIASAVAGTSPLERVDLRVLVGLSPMRPDVIDRLLDHAERRLTQPGVGDAERRELLEVAVEAVVMAAGKEEGARGRRLADLFKLCAPQLSSAELRRYQGMVRGPAAESLAAALGAMPPADPAEESAAVAEQDLDARVVDLHGRGLEWLDQGRRLANAEEAEAAACFHRAMDLLDQARELARGASMPRRALTHASAGNVRRALAPFDEGRADALLAEAETLYREALPWTRKSSRERALVSKVLADCLIERMDRDGVDRWAEAMAHYEAALEGRPGGFERWETLLAVADAELEAPGRPEEASQKAALARLEEALEHVAPDDRGRGKVNAQRMLDPLSALARRGQLNRGEAERFARRIGAACPELTPRARLAAMGFGLDVDSLTAQAELFKSRFMTNLGHMLRPIQPQALDSVPPELREFVEEGARSGRGQFDAGWSADINDLRSEVARLRAPAPGEDEEERAARLVARARILRSLLELGVDVLSDHATTSAEAEEAVRALEHPGLRAFGLCDVSRAWQERGPGGDFKRAAALLEEALDLCPPQWLHLRADIVGAHAHATRFRPDLPGRVAVAQAIEEYHEALALYFEVGNADGAAETLQNLAEAMEMREDLPRPARLREVIAVELQAIAIARALGDARLGPLLGNLAWTLTQLADAGVPDEERRRALEEAGPIYEEARRITHDPAALQRIHSNHLAWRSIAEPGSAIEGLRSRLRGLDRATKPREWAVTAHNLAEELCARHPRVADLLEPLALYREALLLRPLDVDPLFHWQTAQSLGELLADLYRVRRRVDLAELGLSDEMARREAARCFRSAIEAARSLGPGSKLVRSARGLGLLAADVTSGSRPDLETANEAMAALDEVLGLAPEDRAAGDAEAEVAAAVAGALAAYRAATATILAVTATDTYTLHGDAAREVLDWVLRARGGQHRRLRARMTRPGPVEPEVWTRWRMALRGRENWAERRAAAAAVRAQAPSFLGTTPDLSATIEWMQAARGAAATLLWTSFGWLLGVVTPRGERADAVVLLLRAEPLDIELGEIITRLRAPTKQDDQAAEVALEVAKKTLADLVRWFRRQVLPALRARLPDDRESLLWSPHGAAAALPLGLVCEDIPSIWTTPCITLPPPPPRPIPSALLVLADPEVPASARAIPSGPEAIAAMARALAPHVPRLEVLLGCGGARGEAVAAGLDVPGLLPDAAPTPGEIRRRISDHRLVIVLAHGEYDPESPERSSLVLLNEQGGSAPLSAGELAESPDLLRGATVVLLACELGQGGARLAAPEGLAGVLIAVGARAVIAPLWPVLSDGALRVGERLARAVTIGIDLGRALQTVTQLVRSEVGEDPGEAGLYGLGPFIAWTG